MMNRLSIELEGASSLLPTASQVQAAWLPIVPGHRIGRRVDRSMAIAVHVSIVIRAVPVMRQTEADLAGTVAVGMRAGDRRTRMGVRVAETVAVRRRRKVT